MFEKSNLKNHLKKNKSVLIYSFMVGLVMGSIPFIYKSYKIFRVQKLIKEQQKIQIQIREKICKKDKSDYQKFLNLGFPKTAIEKLYYCMKEQ